MMAEAPHISADPGPKHPLFRRKARQARFEVISVLGRFPQLIPVFRPFRRGQSVDRTTVFVIEGFPRSGNTFATAAFDVANPESHPTVAHHVHSPAQILAALRLGIPVLVLIRPPEEAVLSFAVQQPHISVAQALRAYVRFYRTLRAYRDRFVVATFDQVVSDFGAVTRRVNQRFGSAFGVFEHTEENVDRALRLIQDDNRRRWRGDELEAKGAFPSGARARLKDALRSEFQTARLRPERTAAEDLYRAFAEASAGL